MNNRKCLQCLEQLRGRTDQKFCSSQCRAAYNNRHQNESIFVLKTINKILKKNHSILVNLNASGKTVVAKNELIKQGYRFEYFTYLSPGIKGEFNYYCYEKGLRDMTKSKVVLLDHETTI